MKEKLFKRMSLILLSMCTAVTLFNFSIMNVSASTIKKIGLNDSITTSIKEEATILEFEINKSGRLEIKLITNGDDSSYYLYDENMNKIYEDNPYFGNGLNSVTGVYSDTYTFYLNKGKYYFAYKCDSSDNIGTETIDITTSFKSSGESFPETTYGNDNETSTANAISANKKYYGFITDEDENDCYKFSLSKEEKITIELNAYFDRINFYIYDLEGTIHWRDEGNYTDSVTGKYSLTEEIILPKGTYIFKVSDTHYCGTYNFILHKEVKKFYVKYYPNGGSGSMKLTTVEYGKTTKLRDNTMKKTGYRFAGWRMYRESDKKWLYTNGTINKWCKSGSQPSGYAKKIYKDEATVAKLSTTNKDVIRAYAAWTANKYSVSYLKNGGTGSMKETTVTFGKSTALRANAFTRSGYKFVGWTCKRKCDGKWYYSNGTKSGWYLEGKQPSGYKKVVYANKQKISKTTSKHNDTVYMVARWEKK